MRLLFHLRNIQFAFRFYLYQSNKELFPIFLFRQIAARQLFVLQGMFLCHTDYKQRLALGNNPAHRF